MSINKKKHIKCIVACLLLASCDEINIDALSEESKVALTSDPQAEVSFVDISNSSALFPLSNKYNDSLEDHYDQYDIGMLRIESHPQYTGSSSVFLDEVACDLDYTFNIENTGVAPLELSNIGVIKATDYSAFDTSQFLYATHEAVFSISNSPDLYLDVGESTTVVVNFSTPYCFLTHYIGSQTEYSQSSSEIFKLSFDTNDLDDEKYEVEIDLYGHWS